MTISRDEAERIRLMSEFKYRVDTQSHINHAKRENTKEIARNLKARGRPLKEIAEGTGLTADQIRVIVWSTMFSCLSRPDARDRGSRG